MSEKQKTITAIILDRSGSMNTIREEAVSGYNMEVQAAKEAAKEGQDVKVCLVTFAWDVMEHLWLVDADNLEESNYSSYVPNGGTAMYDAMGYVIQKLQQTVEDDENTAYLIKVISDGLNNSSMHFNAKQVCDMIGECKANNRWTFAFMGCSEEDLKKVAKDTGIEVANMAAWNAGDKGLALGAMHCNRSSSQSYYKARGTGVLRTANLYSQDSAAAANYENVSLNSFGFADNAEAQVVGTANTFAEGCKVDWNNCLKGKK